MSNPADPQAAYGFGSWRCRRRQSRGVSQCRPAVAVGTVGERGSVVARGDSTAEERIATQFMSEGS